MNAANRPGLIPATVCMMALVTVVWIADRKAGLDGIRLRLFDAMTPARNLVTQAAENAGLKASDRPEAVAASSEIENDLLQNELQRRQLLIENARLRRRVSELERQQPLRRVVGANLVDFVSVEARVLNPNELPQGFGRAVLDAGRDRELLKSQLVVSGSGAVIDKGEDHGLSPGQKVVDGSVVLGRLKSVARWVSQVQPVTSPEFSAAVQLIRRSPHGATFGAEGILAGTTDGCEISGVASTETVSVGDEVYSASLDGLRGPRLFFGTVSQVDFAAGGQWKIKVKPAADGEVSNDVVAVVRPRLNSERVAEHSTTQVAANQ